MHENLFILTILFKPISRGSSYYWPNYVQIVILGIMYKSFGGVHFLYKKYALHQAPKILEPAQCE
jgi:hypothetical protein